MLFLFFAMMYTDGPMTLIEHEELYTPISMRVNGKGNIYLVDNSEHKIWYFSDAGEHLGSFGRKGQGPGELQNPVDVGFLGDGRILVADAGNRRVHLFKEDGSFIKMFSIKEQPVGQIQVFGKDQFLLSRIAGNSFHFSMGETNVKRFGIYSLDGTLARNFGDYIDHKSPLFAIMLNKGPLAVSGERVYHASNVSNILSVYEGDRVKQFQFPLSFVPIEPSSSQKETKGSDGNISISMSVSADITAVDLAMAGQDRLLLLRKKRNEPGDEATELVLLNPEGETIKVLPYTFNATLLATSPDGSTAYVLDVLDEESVVKKVKL